MTGTHFLNVDLDISSRRDLAPLLAALDPHVVVLHARRAGGVSYASLELSAFSRYKNADACIAGFARILEALPLSARRLWKGSVERAFNVGIQAERGGGSFFEARIKPATLRRVVALGGSIVITVYPPASPQKQSGTRVRKTVRGRAA